MTQKEVAAALGISEREVRRIEARALVKLRVALAKRGVRLEDVREMLNPPKREPAQPTGARVTLWDEPPDPLVDGEEAELERLTMVVRRRP